MSTKSEYTVRRLEPSDAPSFFAVVRASLPELTYWMPWCKPDYSLEDAEAWISFTQISWANRTQFPLGVVETSSGKVIGGTGINQINKHYQIGNIGYWVGTPYVGRGVARFAAKQAALLGFGELGLTRLEIVALTHNAASQRVAESIGALRECEARNRLYFHGQPHDAVVYSLVESDVQSGHGSHCDA